MRAPEPDTWDMKLGRAIRRFFDVVMFGPLFGSSREGDRIDAWERAKNEAWDLEEQAARQRSSDELHEELERAQKRSDASSSSSR